MEWSDANLDVSCISGVLPNSLGFWEIKKYHKIDEHEAVVAIKIGLISTIEEYGNGVDKFCRLDHRIAQLDITNKIFGKDLFHYRIVENWEIETKSGFYFLLFTEKISAPTWNGAFNLAREEINNVINLLVDLIYKYWSIEASRGSSKDNVPVINIF